MARSTFKVLFYVNGSKEKDGIVPIMGRVTINGTVAQFSCKQTIPKTLWDAKGNRAKGKSAEARNINLALEEAVANIIMYAYPSQEEHIILLKVTSTPKQLVFLLTDKGASFDPTQVEDTDITLSLEERPIGGLGIFLIRSIMNEISYQRLDNENRLTMKKDI